MATNKEQENTPEIIDRTTMNIYQKLVLVRQSIDSVSKDADTASESNKKGYKFVSGAQVLAKIKSKMDELGVILKPNLNPENTIESFEAKDRYGNIKDKYQYTGVMTYTFINADDPADRDEVQWFLTGIQDDPSKAFGSALTYSERYFILKYFGFPTDDDDPDKKNDHDDKKTTGKPRDIKAEAQQRKAQKDAEKAREQAANKETPQQTEIGREITALWSLTGKNKEIWAAAMKTCGLKSKDDITEDHLFKLEATINELVDAAGTGAE